MVCPKVWVRVHVLFEVQVKVFKHQVQLLIAMHNILQPARNDAVETDSVNSSEHFVSCCLVNLPDYIIVLQLLKQGYLSDRSTRNALFFLLQAYLL